jgi:hypothetical protein
MRHLRAPKSISLSGHHLQVKIRPHLDIVLPPDRSAPGLGDFEWLQDNAGWITLCVVRG